MKRILTTTVMLGILASAGFAEDVTTEATLPDQKINNEKGFAGINYSRQDIAEPGTQTIVNDHSAFNININIFRKQKPKRQEVEEVVQTEEVTAE